MKILLKKVLFIGILFLVGCNNSNKIEENNLDYSSKINHLKPSPIGKEIIEAEVGFVSPTFKANGKLNVEYELAIVSNFKRNLVLNSIAIINTDSLRSIINSFNTNYLKDNFVNLGNRNLGESLIIEPGQKGVIRLNISFDPSKSIPSQVFHTLKLGITSNDSLVEVPFDVALFDIKGTTSIELGLPFNKGKWFYMAENHKDSRIITHGTPTYPQRFAIDWAYINDDGFFVNGNIDKNESYPTYGQEILAVANGIVIDIKNEIPDNIPGQLDVRITRETIAGNYIVLDIGNNIYAVYAHLIPNSFKVKVGEKVNKGQVVGLLGNSGNSDGPHLHFHLETKSQQVLGGEGIPYHFEKFNQLATYSLEDIDTLFDRESLDLTNSKSDTRLNELPTGNGVIEFK